MRTGFATEDWWAVWLGLLVVALALPTAAGCDLLGWVVSTSVWLDPSKALGPIAKSYGGLPGVVSLLLTFLLLLGLVTLGAWSMRLNLVRFVAGFTAIFWVSYLCWLAGHVAYIAATPDKRSGFGITWSLGLTGEAGFIVA